MTVILALKAGPDEDKTHLLFATDSRYVFQDSSVPNVHEAQKLLDVGNESSHVLVAGAGDANFIYRLVGSARLEFLQRNYVGPNEVARYLIENLPENPQLRPDFVVCGCEAGRLEILDVDSDGQIYSRPYATRGSGRYLIEEGLKQRERKGLLSESPDLAEGFFDLYDLIRYSWAHPAVDNRLQIGLMRRDGLARMIRHHETPFAYEEEEKRYLMLNVNPKSPLRFKPAKRLADEFYSRLMLRAHHMSEEDSEYNKIGDDLKNGDKGFLARIKIQRSLKAARARRAREKHRLQELLAGLEQGGQSMRSALIKDYKKLEEETEDLWR